MGFDSSTDSMMAPTVSSLLFFLPFFYFYLFASMENDLEFIMLINSLEDDVYAG